MLDQLCEGAGMLLTPLSAAIKDLRWAENMEDAQGNWGGGGMV